jgi:hypothetical protein
MRHRTVNGHRKLRKEEFDPSVLLALNRLKRYQCEVRREI